MWLWLKIALSLVKNVFFGMKQGISKILYQIAAKHIAHVLMDIYVYMTLYRYMADIHNLQSDVICMDILFSMYIETVY